MSRLCLGGAQQPFLQPKDWEREEKKGFLLSWSIVTMGEKCHEGLVQQGTVSDSAGMGVLDAQRRAGDVRGARQHSQHALQTFGTVLKAFPWGCQGRDSVPKSYPTRALLQIGRCCASCFPPL